MDKETKFMRMVDLLKADKTARDKLLADPETLLTDLGIDPKILNDPLDQQSFDRAEALLKDANIKDKDNAVTGLRKLGIAAKKHFVNGHEVEVEPFAIRLLERVPAARALNWTATGTVNCTYGPWDGCKPDGDS